MKSFQQTQLDFARYLRAPDEQPIPAAMEARRMKIYRELIYNNIENFLATTFPVLRSLLSAARWQQWVSEFIARHRCQTPYFLEISEEFLQFLVATPKLYAADLPFVPELAHYEWLELALMVSEEQLPAAVLCPKTIATATFGVSPLAVCLGYQYPVQKISSAYQPKTAEPVQLVVYRNRADKVCFMVVNSLTLRLLHLMQADSQASLNGHLDVIAAELQHGDRAQLDRDAEALIAELYQLDILLLPSEV